MKACVRHLENQHGHRLHGLRRKVNRALRAGGLQPIKELFQKMNLKSGHAAGLATCSSEPFATQIQKFCNEEEKRIIEQEMEKIDLMSMPTNLICPILFYHSHSSALKDSNNSDYNALTEQLEKVRQCSAQTECTQNDDMRDEIAQLRKSLAEEKESLDMVEDWYATKTTILNNMLRDFKKVLNEYDEQHMKAVAKERNHNEHSGGESKDSR